MKKLKTIGISLLIAICFSCSNDDELTQEQEVDKLNQMFFEIESMASSLSCIDSSEWTFTSYGNKACGGPVGFIAYSKNIDVDFFLQRVEEYRIKQQKFNAKWGIFSDCSVPPKPTGVICENTVPVLEY